jgi:isocitrate dehydrogenase
MNNIKFTHELIKGKIAEIIFEQMIHNTKGYTVLEFGYEKVVHQLAKAPKSEDARAMIEIVRKAPDYAIVNEDTHNVTLVEVKYMAKKTNGKVNAIAKEIEKSWRHAALFIATPNGFFFDQVDTIIANKGAIKPFHHGKIQPKVVEQYLAMLNEFIVIKS